MRSRVDTHKEPKPGGELEWLVLRCVAALAPCTEASLIDYIAGADALKREPISAALRTLKELALIRLAADGLAITDAGRHHLTALSLSGPRQTQASTPATLLAESRRLGQLCREQLAQFLAVAQQPLQMNGLPPHDGVRQIWRRKAAPMLRRGAASLAHMRTQLANAYRKGAKAGTIVLRNRQRQAAALLAKAAKSSGLPPNPKLAGLGVGRPVLLAGALVLASGALAIAGGMAFFSRNAMESTQAFEVAQASEVPRTSEVAWLYDMQRDPQGSIFITNDRLGTTLIEGLAIWGENISTETLTNVEAAIKADTGQEIKLKIRVMEDEEEQADKEDIPSGSAFVLESRFDQDDGETGIELERFLSEHGGLIFRFRYKEAGAQKTLFEYLSPAKLSRQLTGSEIAASSQ